MYHMIEIDMEYLKVPEIAHPYLKEKLGFPEYYGCNLDALYDCLTEISEDTVVNMMHPEGELTAYQDHILQVFVDASIDNVHLLMMDTYPEE